MSYIVSQPERTEEGAFIIKLLAEDGTILAEGQGETEEAATEDAKSKL